MLTTCVVWQLFFWRLCQAIRDPVAGDGRLSFVQQKEDGNGQCPSATPSDLDLRSLVLQPDFTFLNSRELFLSKTASCDQPMHGVKLLKVKKSTAARRAQLAQRFRVKQVKTMLQAAAQNKQDRKSVV